MLEEMSVPGRSVGPGRVWSGFHVMGPSRGSLGASFVSVYIPSNCLSICTILLSGYMDRCFHYTPRIGQTLLGFHHRVACLLTGMQLRREAEGSW